MRTRTPAVLALGACCLSGAARSDPDPRDERTIDGVLVSLGEMSLVLRTEEGALRSFVLDPPSTIEPPTLVPGRRVRVRYAPAGRERWRLVGVSELDTGAGQPGGEPAVDPGGRPAHAGSSRRRLGLVGMALLAAGLALRALSRRPS